MVFCELVYMVGAQSLVEKVDLTRLPLYVPLLYGFFYMGLGVETLKVPTTVLFMNMYGMECVILWIICGSC